MTTLYQFSFSHFCEKARWALDHKQHAFTAHNLLPGPHLRTTRKLAPKSHVPILVDSGRTVQGSAAIIDYLDEKHPAKPLTPDDPQLAKDAREWEAYLDREIGVTLRVWFYHHTLPIRSSALTFLLHDGPLYGGLLYALIFPKVRTAMLRAMDINAGTAAKAERRFNDALSRLDTTLQRQQFLVGDEFTRADLTACALLNPLFKPDEKLKAAFAEPVLALSERYTSTPVYTWVHETYRNYRS